MTRSPSQAAAGRFVFGEFLLDVAGHRLWREAREIPLRPKSWDVLCYLLARPGLLVTKETLHGEIWRGSVVSDDTLTKSIAELRQALGDNTRSPRFIETVHGRGFRFVAEVRPASGVDAQRPTTTFPVAEAGLTFVGRAAEVVRLQECLHLAASGARQVVFITGEAGIGKTALAEAFLRSPALRDSDIYVLHGQCIQQHGQREPYMPVLEALERVLSSSRGPALIPSFRRLAPCWYVQIP